MPAKASVQVSILAQQVPTLSMLISCHRNEIDQTRCCTDKHSQLMSANLNSKFVMTATSDTTNTSFEWAVSPTQRLGILETPLGSLSSTFVLQGSPSIFVQGSIYFVTLYGKAAGVTSSARSFFIINSPPRGGTFKACLQEATVSSGCVRTGMSIIDIFRLQCDSWTDPEGDVTLSYRFGYSLSNGQNSYSNESVVWFDWSESAIKDLSLPSGNASVMAQVKDECGSQTEIFFSSLTVADGSMTMGTRRILSAGNIWSVAKDRVKSSLQTFRPDNVNALTSAVSIEMARLSEGAADAVDLRASLLQFLRRSVDQGIKTRGFICEAFGAAALVVNRFTDLSSNSISIGSDLTDFLSAAGVDGNAVPLSCATNAATVIGNFIRALSKNQSIATPEVQVEMVNCMKKSLGSIARQMLIGSVPGEARTVVVAGALTLSVFRVAPSELLLVLPRKKIYAMFDGSLSSFVQFSIPDQSNSNAISLQQPYVDAEMQSYAIVPASCGMNFVSGVHWLSVSSSIGDLTTSKWDNMTVVITVPILNIAIFNTSSAAHLFECVNWYDDKFSLRDCKVHSVKISDFSVATSVTCVCARMVMVAVLFTGEVVSESQDGRNTTALDMNNASFNHEKPAGMAGLWPFGWPSSEPGISVAGNNFEHQNELGGRGGVISPVTAYLAASTAVLAVGVIYLLLQLTRFFWLRSSVLGPVCIKKAPKEFVTGDVIYLGTDEAGQNQDLLGHSIKDCSTKPSN
eukprot:CAMPEP_0172151830 /NCGR_PEP_ID=MMETSP1050-20130122/467_1 /TAXON_ID=233186 /ORGANISM="Cryptomonas curvata, Strain CCAP979/52" /LENGTH=741 /DNA_ID=CAMNT_0012820019 /DNA_START=245 /DNA_END=2470 /DNA_ORIENTATION=+